MGRSLGGEGVGGPWEEERECEVLGRRRRSGGSWEEREWEFFGRMRGSGRFLEGGEGVGGPWEEEREGEVLGRRGSGRSLGGGEGVGGPCTVSPTHVHSLVYCCEAPSEGHMEQPHTYGISCNRGCSSQILPFLLNSHFYILRCWPLLPAYPLIAKCLQANLSLMAADP